MFINTVLRFECVPISHSTPIHSSGIVSTSLSYSLASLKIIIPFIDACLFLRFVAYGIFFKLFSKIRFNPLDPGLKL